MNAYKTIFTIIKIFVNKKNIFLKKLTFLIKRFIRELIEYIREAKSKCTQERSFFKKIAILNG